MLDYLQDEMNKEIEAWIIEQYDINLVQVSDVLHDMKAVIETEAACIVITYLRSSYITGSHQFKIACYENEPFMETLMYRFIDLTPLPFKQIPISIEKFSRKIRSKFIRVLPFEIEEIRRYYMECLYKNSRFFFGRTLDELGNKEKVNPVYFGEELGEVEQIGVI